MHSHQASIVTAILLSVFTIGRPLCIDELTGVNQRECIDHQDGACCKSLNFSITTMMIENRTNNVTLIIQGDVTISVPVRMINFSNLVLQGQNSPTLRCNVSEKDTGLYFERVKNLKIMNLNIQGCSMLTESTTSVPDDWNQLLKSLSAVYILNCQTASLIDVRVHHNRGRGVVMYDTGGEVVIHKSTFEGNGVPLDSKHPGGGGLYIEFSCRSFASIREHKNCTEEMANSRYVISETIFINNSVVELNPNETKFFNYDRGSFQGLGRGGGMCLILNGRTSSNSVVITNCNFTNNKATTWGGGLYIALRSNACSNNILLNNTHFIENQCTIEGGGGVYWSLLSYKGRSSSNVLLAVNCNFTGNLAKTNGGGFAIVSSRETEVSNIQNQLDNEIRFTSCNWRNNMAELGSAIDISPGVWNVLGNGILPVPIFENCTFKHNYIMKDRTLIHKEIEQITSGVGTMVITNFAVRFLRSMTFTNNKGSAIYLQSGLITLEAGSELTLLNNVAKHGGAMAFIAFSVMYVEPNTKIIFKNNEADIKGGAIYVKSINQHERFTSRSCFLQSTDRNTRSEERNVTITFRDNVAKSGYGHSLFATTLQSCAYSCKESNGSSTTSMSIFDCLGSIEGLNRKHHDIATNTRKYEYDFRFPLTKDMIIPGRYFKIPIKSFDELGQISKVVYGLSLRSQNNITLDDIDSAYISNQRIRVHGPQHTARNTLMLERDETAIWFNITTIECPPGHYLTDSVCQCDTSKLRGIWKCDRRNKIASIINGFWIGRCSNDEQCTGVCPIGYCTTNISTDLPASINDTDRYVCTNSREGRLCGKCVQNHSAYYHSPVQRCGDESLCGYGIALYIIAELVPVTFIFIIIILSNVSFSNGSTNGFILYAQILDSLIISTYNNVHYPEFMERMKDIEHLIYGVSNLNFFNLEQLSFCLWKGATTLDTLAWRYVTIVYSLFLVLLTLWLHNIAWCKKICICWRPHALKNAVIHGLTAFLVMCYSQCARVSFQLLNTVHLTGYNSERIETVIQFSGEQKLFDSIHAIYGLTAIVFALVIVILPPLLLISYPLTPNLLSLCRLSELNIINKVTNLIPTPLFDSFQSCYRDRFRYFSGIYFFYRVIPLLLYAIVPNMVVFYFLVEIFLVLALSLHAIVQPYKKSKHNVIDAMIFTNLAIINTISLFNYQKVMEGKDNLYEIKDTLTITMMIQLMLVYLPLFCLATYAVWRVIKWRKKKKEKTHISNLDRIQETLLDSIYLPPLRESNDIHVISSTLELNHKYHEMKSRKKFTSTH